MSDKIEIGSEVTWTSQAAGTTKQKRGVVVAVMRPGFYLGRSVLIELLGPDFTNGKYNESALGWGESRSYESYIIAVPADGKGKPRLYWPRSSQLRKVESS